MHSGDLGDGGDAAASGQAGGDGEQGRQRIAPALPAAELRHRVQEIEQAAHLLAIQRPGIALFPPIAAFVERAQCRPGAGGVSSYM